MKTKAAFTLGVGSTKRSRSMTDVPEEELLAALATCDQQKADRPADEVAAALVELRTDLLRASALPCRKLAFAAKNGLWKILTDLLLAAHEGGGAPPAVRKEALLLVQAVASTAAQTEQRCKPGAEVYGLDEAPRLLELLVGLRCSGDEDTAAAATLSVDRLVRVPRVRAAMAAAGLDGMIVRQLLADIEPHWRTAPAADKVAAALSLAASVSAAGSWAELQKLVGVCGEIVAGPPGDSPPAAAVCHGALRVLKSLAAHSPEGAEAVVSLPMRLDFFTGCVQAWLSSGDDEDEDDEDGGESKAIKALGLRSVLLLTNVLKHAPNGRGPTLALDALAAAGLVGKTVQKIKALLPDWEITRGYLEDALSPFLAEALAAAKLVGRGPQVAQQALDAGIISDLKELPVGKFEVDEGVCTSVAALIEAASDDQVAAMLKEGPLLEVVTAAGTGDEDGWEAHLSLLPAAAIVDRVSRSPGLRLEPAQIAKLTQLAQLAKRDSWMMSPKSEEEAPASVLLKKCEALGVSQPNDSSAS